jgi:hypothetical protein
VLVFGELFRACLNRFDANPNQYGSVKEGAQ